MWIPRLPTDGTPIFQQILASLERDIGDGVLAPGERLPPQRVLARHLGVSLGTVTHAYEEADRRGLTVGHVGRGTYIAGGLDQDSIRRPGEMLDLSLNYPPMVAAERLLSEVWGRVRRRADFLDVLNYGPMEGLPQHRRAAAVWLRKTAHLEAPASRLIMTSGGQAGLDLVTARLCQPGDPILCEQLTFSGIKALAQQRNFRLVPVGMDGGGMDPDALARTAHTSGAKVLYTIPTLHNPTGLSMDPARRADILRVARKYDLKIIEDDVYAAYVDIQSLALPLSMMAPERCYYVSALSKSIAPGLRTGFVVAPTDEAAAEVARGVRVSCFSSQSMGMLVAQQAMEEGAADQIIKENRRTVRLRNHLLRQTLSLPEMGCPFSPHVWLPLQEHEAERLEARLLREGIKATSPGIPRVAGGMAFGLRFCVGSPRREEDFQEAMPRIEAVLHQPADLSMDAVV